MRFPWANSVLLILLLIQVVTGYFGFVNTLPRSSWILWLHGVGAYALVLLLYWKGAVIWETVNRRKTWTRQRVIFLVLLAFLLITLVLGILWTFAGPIYWGGFSLVSLHIYTAIPLMLLMLWHAWKMRWIRRVPTALDRRLFLRTGLMSLGGLVVWWVSGRVKQTRRFTGSYEIGSFTGRFPVTSWLNDKLDPIDTDNWHLTIKKLDGTTNTLTYNDIIAQATTEMTATLDCTGGFYTTQEWRGIRLSELLDLSQEPKVQSITIRSITNYHRRFTPTEASELLLATHLAHAPLTHGHGAPLRLVAPTKRGYAWIKWITEIELNKTSALWQPPLPLQ